MAAPSSPSPALAVSPAASSAPKASPFGPPPPGDQSYSLRLFLSEFWKRFGMDLGRKNWIHGLVLILFATLGVVLMWNPFLDWLASVDLNPRLFGGSYFIDGGGGVEVAENASSVPNPNDVDLGNSTQENQSLYPSNGNNLAICLAGGARSFELTGVTILRHIIEYYHPLATFVSTPLDENTHKFSILSNSSRPIIINVISQKPMYESDVVRKVLSPSGSPNARQGLLQYFNLVESCADLITSYQKSHGVTFDRILRTRPDSFWNGDPSPLEDFDSHAFTTPAGSVFSGLNDRFSFSNYDAGILGLRRLTLLDTISSKGYSNLNSERALNAQISVHKIETKRANLPFCILSKRKYSWPPNAQGVPVLSLSSKNTMNGGKCRPCKPAATGKSAEMILSSLIANWGNIGTVSGIDLCDGSGDWDPEWQKIYDSAVDNATIYTRKHLTSRNFESCIQENSILIEKAMVYNGPPANILCTLGFWGHYAEFDDMESSGKHRTWYVLSGLLSSSSLVYSFGLQSSLSWEKALVTQFGCSIHSFDCIPFTFQDLGTNLQNTSNLNIYDICLGRYSEDRVFHTMESLPDPFWSNLFPKKQGKPKNSDFGGSPLRLHFQDLDSIIQQLGHSTVDLVRVNVGEVEFLNVCLSGWSKRNGTLPICQLVVNFSTQRRKDDSSKARNQCIDVLKKLGLYITKCFGAFDSHVCHFLSTHHCASTHHSLPNHQT